MAPLQHRLTHKESRRYQDLGISYGLYPFEPTSVWNFKKKELLLPFHFLGVTLNSEILQKFQAESEFLTFTCCCPGIALLNLLFTYSLIHLYTKKRKENLEKFT